MIVQHAPSRLPHSSRQPLAHLKNPVECSVALHLGLVCLRHRVLIYLQALHVHSRSHVSRRKLVSIPYTLHTDQH